MLAGACTGESSRDANDVSIGRLKLLGEIDFVSGGIFEENIKVRDFLADTDRSSRGRVEAASSHGDGGGGPGEGNASERSSERHDR